MKVGDRILFGKWSGTEIKLDGEDLLIMKESDVMGVIEQRRRHEEGRLTATRARLVKKLPIEGVFQWLQRK